MENNQQHNEYIIFHFQQGSNHALQHIFDSYYKPLLYFANKIIADLPEAEDITAESFYKLYLNREHFESLPKIKAFLYMANRNACLDLLKARRRHYSSHKEIFYLADTSEATAKTDSLALHEMRYQIEQLPKQCALIFKMIFYQGKKTNEISTLLGINTKTVLNQKLKAIKLLREALLKKGLLSFLYAWFFTILNF